MIEHGDNFENMARKPLVFFFFFWGGSVVVPCGFPEVWNENRLRRKWKWNDPHRRAELESPEKPQTACDRGRMGSVSASEACGNTKGETRRSTSRDSRTVR